VPRGNGDPLDGEWEWVWDLFCDQVSAFAETVPYITGTLNCIALYPIIDQVLATMRNSITIHPILPVSACLHLGAVTQPVRPASGSQLTMDLLISRSCPQNMITGTSLEY